MESRGSVDRADLADSEDGGGSADTPDTQGIPAPAESGDSADTLGHFGTTVGAGWGRVDRGDCRELTRRVDTRCTHALQPLQIRKPWAMPTVKPALVLRALWDGCDASTARCARAGRGVAMIVEVSATGIIAGLAVVVTAVL